MMARIIDDGRLRSAPDLPTYPDPWVASYSRFLYLYLELFRAGYMPACSPPMFVDLLRILPRLSRLMVHITSSLLPAERLACPPLGAARQAIQLCLTKDISQLTATLVDSLASLEV